LSRPSTVPAPFSSYVAGAWCRVDSNRVVRRENPARPEETAAEWCPATFEEARAAMDAAAAAAPAWTATPLAKRADLLTRLVDAVEAQAEEFATLIICENGKTRRDARAEIASGLADARHAIAAALAQGLVEPVSAAGAPVRSELVLEPVGPCLLVTPWNFPLATILRKLVPALLYGNPAVVKPSELTPGPACRLFALLGDLPLPAGVASLVLGPGAELGPVLASHPALRAISLTGSTGAGASLAGLTAGGDVRLQLEMGGKNSLVVLADADLEAAVEAAIIGGFSCTGQWCTGTGRVIVEQSIYNEFTERLATRAVQLRPGPGEEDSSDLGPLVSAARLAFAQSVIAAAVAAGARVRCEGQPRPGGYFFAPTVLAGVTESMAAFTDELFVPVLPVMAARDAADAVRLANAGRYGLSASIFSRDTAKALALARGLAAGIVHVNLHTAYREPALPVSAWRESGRGLPEGGRFSRDFFTRPRAVYLRRP
jgi:acyl-CoA reductase-like NAD-dependent aldehyde dehydrogenase